jgi:NTE family protein
MSSRASPTHTALVLSGGGARAAYQAGALVALAEVVPGIDVPIVTGVSAGAINAVSIAAHAGPLKAAAGALHRDWERLTPADAYTVRAGSLVGGMARLIWHTIIGRRHGGPAFRGFLDMSPLRRFLARSIEFPGIARNVAEGRVRAVALSTTCYATGATVTFVEGREDLPMWARARRYAVRTQLGLDHVIASSAIPIVFPAVWIGGHFYGDGSARQTAPLAPAIHLGARRIIAISMRAAVSETYPEEAEAYPSSAEVFGLLMNSVFLDSLDSDAERLDRVNRTIQRLSPDERTALGVRPIGLLLLQPSRDLGALARAYQAHVPPLLATILRAMGGRRARASDLMSYLLFDRAFTGSLMELGYRDTLARRVEIERFFATEY